MTVGCRPLTGRADRNRRACNRSTTGIDDVMWPGTFTVDAGALTLVTLFTP